jgi:hypothetical protein
MAKIVEMRRRTRIDRSRQIANNNEFQRNIMDSIRVYNDETERNRAMNELRTSMGPPLTRVHQQIVAGVITPTVITPQTGAQSDAPRVRTLTTQVITPQTEAQANAQRHVQTLTAQNRTRRERLATAPVQPVSKSKFKLSVDQTRLDSYDQ